jgi:hypothetical protein
LPGFGCVQVSVADIAEAVAVGDIVAVVFILKMVIDMVLN